MSESPVAIKLSFMNLKLLQSIIAPESEDDNKGWQGLSALDITYHPLVLLVDKEENRYMLVLFEDFEEKYDCPELTSGHFTPASPR